MKKIIIVTMALTAGLVFTGCENKAKIESGTYVCSKDGKEEMKWMFDMENHTFDMIIKGTSIKDTISAIGGNINMIVGDFNEKTQEYELKQGIEGMMETFYVKKNGDIFETRNETEKENFTCIKQEK